MKRRRKMIPPILLPAIFFGLAVCVGALALHLPMSVNGGDISWSDALFTATSAVCVTGLAVKDTGAFFSQFGQSIILVLIQIGGLGIMTFSCLTFYLWRQKISLTDRIAVGQAFSPEHAVNLGGLLKKILLCTVLVEATGTLLIYGFAPSPISWYGALFHAVSAFCNAGFSLNADSLMAWKGQWSINLIFMGLIILGGLGFSVIIELYNFAAHHFVRTRSGKRWRFSWHASIVIKSSIFLILFGWGTIFLAENVGYRSDQPFFESVLTALFQSVTCRTAGFNTVDIGMMTNVSLLIMLILMFIGGAPGSCAGGIKVTTFRVICSFVTAQLKGRSQIVIGRYAVEPQTINRALILVVFVIVLILTSTMALLITEGGAVPHPQSRGTFMEVMFEVVSAFGTVGLSIGLTPRLSMPGKWLITCLMFIGRLGPLIFLSAIYEIRREQFFKFAEDSVQIG